MKFMNKLQKKREELKKDNNGFSLVELIIVIAIMAILVGIVGTQVIPYINKSKLAKDREIVSSYSTAAVSAYSMVAAKVTTPPAAAFMVYAKKVGPDSDEKTIATQIADLTYDSFPSDKFKSKEGKGASDVGVFYDATNHKVIATVTGSAGDVISVESDM